MSRCPAVRLAVSRTPSASGRMNKLIVSIIIRMGISGPGVPSGRRCPRAWVGWFRMPIITVANQSGTASPRLRDNCVVGVKVYGSSPNIFSVIKKIINEARRAAHLWPPTLRGSSSCCVKRLINHPCKVIGRLFSHRAVGVGNKIQGRVRARAISGIPR